MHAATGLGSQSVPEQCGIVETEEIALSLQQSLSDDPNSTTTTETKTDAAAAATESFVIDFGSSVQKPPNLQDAFKKYKKKRQVSGLCLLSTHWGFGMTL